MKKWMLSLLGVMALSIVFTGCNTSEGSSSVVTQTDKIPSNTGNNPTKGVDIEVSDINEFGISSTLGTPPPLPVQ